MRKKMRNESIQKTPLPSESFHSIQSGWLYVPWEGTLMQSPVMLCEHVTSSDWMNDPRVLEG
jgi:hypothetical protein